MRQQAEGKSLSDIRAAIDAAYLQYEPPTPTPRP